MIRRQKVTGTAIEWVASGAIMGAHSLHARATVMVATEAARKIQRQLIDGEPIQLPLLFDELVELTVS
jgi:hypothetical protein